MFDDKERGSLEGRIVKKLKRSVFSLATTKREKPSCHYQDISVATLKRIIVTTPHIRYVSGDENAVMIAPELRRANEVNGIPIMELVLNMNNSAKVVPELIASLGLTKFKGSESDAINLLDRLICVEGIFNSIPETMVKKSPVESSPLQRKVFKLGYSAEEVEYLSSLNYEQLQGILEKAGKNYQSINLVEALFAALTGKILPRANELGLQYWLEVLKSLEPKKVLLIGGKDQYRVEEKVASILDGYTFEEIEKTHIPGSYQIYETAALKLALASKNAPEEIILRIVDIIAALTDDNCDKIATGLGIVLPDWVQENKVFRKKEFIVDELVNFYPFIMTREPRSLKQTMTDKITKTLTLRELLSWSNLNNSNFRTRERAATMMLKETEGPVGWSQRRTMCANEDFSYPTMGSNRDIFYEKDSEDWVILSYGNNFVYNCFEITELLGAFSIQKETDENGTEFEQFSFTNPMYDKTKPELLDPLTDMPVEKVFTKDQMVALGVFLTKDFKRRNMEDSRNAMELFDKIKEGLKFQDAANSSMRKFTSDIAAFNDVDKAAVVDFFVWLFFLGMFWRYWDGPGTNYSLSFSELLHREHTLRTFENVRIHFNYYDENIILKASPKLKTFLESLPLFDIDYVNKVYTLNKQKIFRLLDLNRAGQFCGAQASDLLCRSAYTYLYYACRLGNNDAINNALNSTLLLYSDALANNFENAQRINNQYLRNKKDAAALKKYAENAIITILSDREESRDAEHITITKNLEQRIDQYRKFARGLSRQNIFDPLRLTATQHVDPIHGREFI